MKVRSLFVVLIASAFLAACDSGGADDALVGSWLRMRDATEMRDRYVFGPDGSFTFDENHPDGPETEDHMTGTYVAAGGIVTATASNTLHPGQARLTFSYHANATQFSSAAMRARSGHTGVIGTWTGVRKLELLDGSGPTASGSELAWVIRADGSFRQTVTPFDGTDVKITDGSWAAEADGTFRMTANGLDVVVTLLDSQALVNPAQIWQRD